jgi:hypothetical protein
VGEEAVYLALGLRDMACGRRADLESAVDTLMDRLPLAAVREGLAVRWEPTDPPVRHAAEALDALGVTATSGQIRAPTSMRDAELTGRLWAAGLWAPPAQDWQQGLTSRALAALAGDLPLRLESAAVETLRHCLVVERLCRRQLLAWLEMPTLASVVVHALHEVSTSRRQRLPLAAVIEAQSADRFLDEVPEDADLIGAATFGQIVMLLERVGQPPVDLTNALWDLVRARNSAAHGHCPTLAQFRAMLFDDRTALRSLRRLNAV